MPKVKGKEQLCCCEKYTAYFKSIQGLGNHTLFERYDSIENVVLKKIDIKYHHFLAQPVLEGDTITWFSKPYNETPKRLSELTVEETIRYEQIKKETLDHYQSAINSLKNEDKYSEAESLEKAVKFVNNDFVYCFDGKTVLGIWGMQLKEHVREPLGIAMKNLFVKKVKDEPVIIDNILDEETQPFNSEPISPNTHTVRFNAGEGGDFIGVSELTKHDDEYVTSNEIPEINNKEGYEFVGWDKDPNGYCVKDNIDFTAQYRKIAPIKIPWYKRFWNWIRSLFIWNNGCLKPLLWLLFLLLLLLLLFWLFRSCNRDHHFGGKISAPISDSTRIVDNPNTGEGGNYNPNDPNTGKGGIYNPGTPYEPTPTPPEYHDILPPSQGVLPPIDTNRIIRKPGNPIISGNRLNILMENEDKSIMDFAKKFKAAYPDGKYKVVYYDNVVKRMQVEVPEGERVKLKDEIPSRFSNEYTLYVFDEAFFESGYVPNDPAFNDLNKSWYLKTIQASQAWDVTRGSSKIKIAIVDNGFSLKHPELSSKVVMPYNVWTHSNEIFAQQVDHGTHVAGTALAITNNGIGICGIASECSFMPVQVSNKQGVMTTTSVLDGVLYALYQGADVINISLGVQIFGNLPDNQQRELQNNHFKEEERLWNEIMKISNKHNAIIVTAAGNENMLAGVDPMKRPKNFVVVSAVDKNNRNYEKAGFSNYGEFSTVSAPGVDIYSTVGNNNYTIMSGTSMAAPIISGAVGLMKSLNKNLTAEQVICILKSTGLTVNGKIGNLLQLDKALRKVQTGNFTDCSNINGKPTPPNSPSENDKRDKLLQERERLQRQLDEIDQQLKSLK